MKGLGVVKPKKEILFNSKHPRYGFLGNFYPSPFIAPFGGGLVLFRSVEHYYQAHKTKNKEFRAKIINANDGSRAKYWGSPKSGCPIIEDFDKGREKLMRKALRFKFAQNPSLYTLLKSTGKASLIEDAPWDDFFGTGKDGKGKNVMGKLLMELRDTSVDFSEYFPDPKVSDLKVYDAADSE